MRSVSSRSIAAGSIQRPPENFGTGFHPVLGPKGQNPRPGRQTRQRGPPPRQGRYTRARQFVRTRAAGHADRWRRCSGRSRPLIPAQPDDIAVGVLLSLTAVLRAETKGGVGLWLVGVIQDSGGIVQNVDPRSIGFIPGQPRPQIQNGSAHDGLSAAKAYRRLLRSARRERAAASPNSARGTLLIQMVARLQRRNRFDSSLRQCGSCFVHCVSLLSLAHYTDSTPAAPCAPLQ